MLCNNGFGKVILPLLSDSKRISVYETQRLSMLANVRGQVCVENIGGSYRLNA